MTASAGRRANPLSHKFFDDDFSPEHPLLTGEHVRHIGFALRMRPGEPLAVCSRGVDYQCEIDRITQDAVILRILSQAATCAEPEISVTLFQALPKSDKLEQIIQKAVELGVTEIVPVLTARCVSRMRPADFEKKRPRLQKIAQAAAEQSGRGIIPAVQELHTLAQAAARMKAAETAIVLYEIEGGCSFSAVPADSKSYSIMIGSEGGFDPQEIDTLVSCGVQPVWLGKRILRCETAPITALSILMFRTGNMG